MALLETLELCNIYVIKISASNQVGDGPFSRAVELSVQSGRSHQGKTPRHTHTASETTGTSHTHTHTHTHTHIHTHTHTHTHSLTLLAARGAYMRARAEKVSTIYHGPDKLSEQHQLPWWLPIGTQTRADTHTHTHTHTDTH